MLMNVYGLFMVLAFVMFMLAALGLPPTAGRYHLGWLGLAFFVIALWVRA